MVEDFGKLISSGFETYVSNLSLSIPFIINLFVTGIFSLAIFFMGIASIFGPSLSSLENAQTPQQLISIILPAVSSHLFEIAALVIIYLLVALFFQSFFTAGAIGMAREATETGKSGLSTMADAGRRNVVNFYLAQLLVGLLFLAGIVLIVPGALKADLSRLSFQENAGAILLLFGGFLLWVLYALILSLVLAIYEYALVVDNLGPVDGILAGIRFFKKHKFDVFLLWLFMGAIAVALMVIGEAMRIVPVLGVIWSFINALISVLVIAPLSTVWWVRLYMTRTEKKIYFNDLLAHPNDLRANQ